MELHVGQVIEVSKGGGDGAGEGVPVDPQFAEVGQLGEFLGEGSVHVVSICKQKRVIREC